MLTRLGYYADKIIEGGWLAAAVFAPLFFNVYSSRVFEPDKITGLRSLVLIMVVAWLVKLGEAGMRGATQSEATTRSGKAAAAATSVAEVAGPSWLGFLRVPVVAAIIVYAVVYLISTAFTVTPVASIFGSYQREQGLYTQLSYMMLGIMVMANMRTRAQVNRLLNFMLMTSVPVALYGVIQAFKLDPLPWAGDTSSRVASSMGNAIFVAAWLIMVVPFTIYRLATGLTAALAARSSAGGPPYDVVEVDQARTRSSRRPRPMELPSYGWAVIANGVGAIMSSLMFFYMALKMMAGLPYPDARTWWLLPVALIYFYFSILALEWLGNHRDDPRQTSVFLPITATVLFFVTLVALTLTWSLANDPANQANILLKIGFDGGGLLWAFFFFLLWCSVSAGVYALANRERDALRIQDANHDRGIVRSSLNAGYALLIVVQVVCIYLTQSRGPWLGLGAGLVVFMVALWLVGRTRHVRWMERLGGVASALVLALALFVAVLNIPNSPLQALGNLPILGRGIDRLSTLTRTEDGTGKVRELIWQGATNLILSDPARALIGWGPESMYVAYNRFYPPALGQVELRNATPDRSHNVEFDQMVTMGVVGLLAYYFLVGTFFFYALRLLKRAANTPDRLFSIAIIAAIASHFIEIQTGIQIASTWSYFYLILGMMVAFGYYMVGYLRPEQATTEAVPVWEDGATPAPATTIAGHALAETRPVPAARVPAAERQEGGAAGQGSRTEAAGSRASSATVVSNGRPGSPVVPPRRSKASQAIPPPPQGRGSVNGGQGSRTEAAGSRGSSRPADGRRRQPSLQYGAQRGGTSLAWFRNPILVVVYAVALLAALIIAWTVNSSSVQADTLFKQAQAYDGAQRYFGQRDANGNVIYPGSIDFYDQAIKLQPNEDYFYLFEGRAWLETAKQVDTETCGTGAAQQGQQSTQVACNTRLNQAYSTDPTQQAAQKKAEKLSRLNQSLAILTRAHELSPLNTDHYANLGRLYLYWADSSGGNDPSKAQLAVQWMLGATQHTPGNAQLWDELGVAYTRNNQFKEGIDALNHSQYAIDTTYANSPFIKGELYQERANTIKTDLNSGTPLPADGETDWGKLALAAGQAYSDTIGLDSSQVLDAQAKNRIDFLLEASQPFTKSNTTLPASVLNNILTDTVKVTLDNQVKNWEGQLTTFVSSHGVSIPAGTNVPTSTLQSLITNPAWADTAAQTWLDSSMQTITGDAAQAHYGLGLIAQETGQTDRARTEYGHALALKPTYTEPNQALQGLK